MPSGWSHDEYPSQETQDSMTAQHVAPCGTPPARAHVDYALRAYAQITEDGFEESLPSPPACKGTSSPVTRTSFVSSLTSVTAESRAGVPLTAGRGAAWRSDRMEDPTRKSGFRCCIISSKLVSTRVGRRAETKFVYVSYSL